MGLRVREPWDGLLDRAGGGDSPALWVVSHQPHVIEHADQIVRLEHGRRARNQEERLGTLAPPSG